MLFSPLREIQKEEYTQELCKLSSLTLGKVFLHKEHSIAYSALLVDILGLCDL